MRTDGRTTRVIQLILMLGLVLTGVGSGAQGVAAASDVRINAGGPAYTDSTGKTWAADKYFNTGHTSSRTSAIGGTRDDMLYQSERWDEDAAPDLAYNIPVTNGEYRVVLHFAEIYERCFIVACRVFDVTLEGAQVLTDLDIFKEAGGNRALRKTFNATVADGSLDLGFIHQIEDPKIAAIEVVRQQGQHMAHAVAGADQTVIDEDGDGSATVTLDGSYSHTHAAGKTITNYAWTEWNAALAGGAVATVNLAVGAHPITLTVTDSGGDTATDVVVVVVASPTSAPGLTGYYYNLARNTPSVLPDLNRLTPDFAQLERNLDSSSARGPFRGTPYSDDFAASYRGFITTSRAGTYRFGLESDDGSRLYLDDKLVIDHDGPHGMAKKTGLVDLTAGRHSIRVDFFEARGGAGLRLYWKRPRLPEAVVPAHALTHDRSAELPVINSLSPTDGAAAGGNTVTLTGFGFVFPSSETAVTFGGTKVASSHVRVVNDTTLEVTAPPGSGTADVTVTTPNGASNVKPYLYATAPPAEVKFTTKSVKSALAGPTSLAYGPDGKLYVGTQTGDVWILTLDDSYNVVNAVKSTAVNTGENGGRVILGVAFNPLDDPAEPKLYVSHSSLYHGGEGAKYNGKVSVLSGPNLAAKTDVVTGLPVSNHDHGINGLEFGQNGELYIQVGGSTNAGVPDAALGGLDETALSAATVVAHLNRPGFQGAVTHDAEGKQTGGLDVEVLAAGFRNPYDVVLHSNGKLYGTDNGPNLGFGDKSTSCMTTGPDPEAPDELNLIVANGYYGHPNRQRGAADTRQCVYHPPTDASGNRYTAPLTTLPPSTDGLTEYWVNTFGGQLRGHLVASQWEGKLYDLALSANGQTVVRNSVLHPDGGLDVVVDPNGAMFVVQHQAGQVVAHVPDEPAGTTGKIISAFPRRGPLAGGRDLLVTGGGFTSSTTVQVGGRACPIKKVLSSTKLYCTVPSGTVAGAVDVTATTGSTSVVLKRGFTYMAA